MGRVDEIVTFITLGKVELVKIAEVLLGELKSPLKDKGINLVIGDGVYEIIADLSEDGGRGARDIRRTIRKEVEDKIANILIDNAGALVNEINVTAFDGKINVDFKS